MNRVFGITIILALVISCMENPQEQVLPNRILSVTAKENITKTEMSGLNICFSEHEALFVQCEGISSFLLSNEGTANNSIFETTYHALYLSKEDADWYGIYPSALEVSDGGTVTGTLPEAQVAPFDPSANFMYSDIVVADYDEENLPDLKLQMNQAFGLLRINFYNSNEEFKDDVLESIQLRTSKVMTGDFSFDIHSPSVSFTGGTSTHVSALYKTEELLGLDEPHWVCLFVNPVQIDGATLVVRTSSHTFTYNSSSVFTPSAGSVTEFSTLNLSDFEVSGHSYLRKRIACWGDSFTSANYDEKTTYCKYLQLLLGTDWEIFNGGISGNRTDEIAARQGGLPVVTGSEFKIPAGVGTISIDGVLKTYDNLGVPGFFPIRSFGGALVNPCKLIGKNGEEILCDITSSRAINGTDTTYSATLKRLTPGAEVIIPAHTPIITYAARELRDVDLSIIYMGTNGSFGTNSDTARWGKYEYLAAQHWAMINFTEKPYSYMVLARHDPDALVWDSWGYSACMESEFGNRYLHMRRIVVESEESVKQWLLYSGAYSDVSEIPQEEIDYAVSGYWPHEFRHTWNDAHPNEYGAKVIAKLVYDKMVELGYLDN